MELEIKRSENRASDLGFPGRRTRLILGPTVPYTSEQRPRVRTSRRTQRRTSLWLGLTADPNARVERRRRRTGAHGGVGPTACTVHSVPRVRVSEAVTRGSIGLPLESDGRRWTSVCGIFPSLVLTRLRWTLPVQGLMVRLLRVCWCDQAWQRSNILKGDMWQLVAG